MLPDPQETVELRIWSHLLEKSLMGNVIFCAVLVEIITLLIKQTF